MKKAKKQTKLPTKAKAQLFKLGVMALVFGLAGQYFLRFSSAATGPTLYVSPSSATVIQNNNFTVEVRVNSAGQDVDGVEAYLTYPADKIEFESTSEAGSAFGIGLPSSGGGGSITLRRLVNPDQNKTVNGSNLLVATVTMKAIAGSGSAAMNFTAQSRVTAPSAGTGSVLVATIGGTYNLSAPPGPASSTTTQTITPVTPATSSPSPSSTTTAQSTKAPPSGGSVSRPNTQTVTPINDKPVSPSTSTPSNTVQPAATNPVVKTKAPSSSRLSASSTLIAKVAGGLFLVACLGMLIKLGLTWQGHMFAAHTLSAAGANHAFVGGQMPPNESGGMVRLTPSQRITPPSDNPASTNIRDIHPD